VHALRPHDLRGDHGATVEQGLHRRSGEPERSARCIPQMDPPDASVKRTRPPRRAHQKGPTKRTPSPPQAQGSFVPFFSLRTSTVAPARTGTAASPHRSMPTRTLAMASGGDPARRSRSFASLTPDGAACVGARRASAPPSGSGARAGGLAGSVPPACGVGTGSRAGGGHGVFWVRSRGGTAVGRSWAEVERAGACWSAAPARGSADPSALLTPQPRRLRGQVQDAAANRSATSSSRSVGCTTAMRTWPAPGGP
jgi:hypothetical protein